MADMFTVVEYSSFFAVRHNPTGKEHPLGDGVDILFDPDGNTLIPGTPGFVEEWTAALNECPDETLAAYFPDLAENEEDDEEGTVDDDYDAPPTEPEEGDYTTTDHVTFYSYGKVVCTVAEDQYWKTVVRITQNFHRHWVNVWWISDHGNAHLLTLE